MKKKKFSVTEYRYHVTTCVHRHRKTEYGLKFLILRFQKSEFCYKRNPHIIDQKSQFLRRKRLKIYNRIPKQQIRKSYHCINKGL